MGCNSSKPSAKKPVQAVITKEEVTYGDDPKMKGYIAFDSNLKAKVPGVIIVHEWWGHDDYVRSRAVQLAEMGYVALALDMYGEGKKACHPSEAGQFAQESLKNFEAASERFLKAIETLKKNEHVDPSKIGAIGYCYGGMVVINMAKKGHDLKAVASFHGSLTQKVKAEKGVCKAKVLVCNGEEDPLIKAEEIEAFKKEMDEAGVHYKFVNYPGATHGFTNPEATKKGTEFSMPLAYNEKADKESWDELTKFFKESLH